MKLSETIRRFDVHLRAERNLSVHTRRAYLSDVRQFAAFLDADVEARRVTTDQLRGFLAQLHAHSHPSTLGRKRLIQINVAHAPATRADV